MNDASDKSIATSRDDDARNLVIAGNGFDRHHGLPTAYSDYEVWLQASYPRLHDEFIGFEYLLRHGDTELWSTLEDSLGVDWDELCGDVLSATYPNMADDNPGWDVFWVELKLRLEFLGMFTCDRFYEWVEGIDVGSVRPCLRLPDDAAFVTFNYTPTLERVYGMSADRILHIHGSVLEKDSPLQFGSPNNRPEDVIAVLEGKYGMDDLYGASIAQGVYVAADSCAGTWKNVSGNYGALKRFLKRFSGIEAVIIMGNRYDGVDKPYYRDVIAPSVRDAEWIFCERRPSAEKLANIEHFCEELDIPGYRMTGYREFSST